MTKRTRVLYFVLLSWIGALLIVIVFMIGSGQDRSIGDTRKMVPEAAFIASCLLCVYLTAFPNRLGNLVCRSPHIQSEKGTHAYSGRYRGHHPDCVGFRNHRISLGKRELCSGCLGLMMGAALSIPLMMIYATSNWDLPRSISAILMAVGFGAVSIAFIETVFGRRRPFVHLIANSAMIVGLFLLVTGMLQATGNGVSGLLVVAFSFLWIDTRIQLSNWRHSLVCDECNWSCKVY